MSAPVAPLLAAGPGVGVTVEALRETLAAMRAARAPKPAAPAPSVAQAPSPPPRPAPAPDFARELARQESAARTAAAAALASSDSIPPEILPLLFDGPAGAAAPGEDEPGLTPAGPLPAAAPMDLTRFRLDAPGPDPVPQPASTGSPSPGPPRPDAPSGPVDVDVDRLARTPENFLPLDVLQAMKARHVGGAPIRADGAGEPRVRHGR